MKITATTIGDPQGRSIDIFRTATGIKVVYMAQVFQFGRRHLDKATMEVAAMVYGPSRSQRGMPAATNSMIYDVRMVLCTLGMEGE